jgi:hypothetical protein
MISTRLGGIGLLLGLTSLIHLARSCTTENATPVEFYPGSKQTVGNDDLREMFEASGILVQASHAALRRQAIRLSKRDSLACGSGEACLSVESIPFCYKAFGGEFRDSDGTTGNLLTGEYKLASGETGNLYNGPYPTPPANQGLVAVAISKAHGQTNPTASSTVTPTASEGTTEPAQQPPTRNREPPLSPEQSSTVRSKEASSTPATAIQNIGQLPQKTSVPTATGDNRGKENVESPVVIGAAPRRKPIGLSGKGMVALGVVWWLVLLM